EVGPAILTTDPQHFQQRLQELYVQGGGDCPEMSVGAIRLAVEVSYPGSFIYVFSDARAKDYEQQEELLQLLQHKQSQVVFVLTGDCGDRSHPGYRVYERIAAISSGQIFHLDKQQVKEVLKWVEEAIQASKVHLLSTDHEAGGEHTWPMPFDSSLKEVTISLSGPAPEIEVQDPTGKVLEEGQDLKELLSIPNAAKVVAVEPHKPGTWLVKTQSSGRHSVRITGVSNVNFQASFSTQPDFDPSQPDERPVQGLPISVGVNCTGLKSPGYLQEIELVNSSGHPLLSVPMRRISNTSSGQLWVGSQLHAPPGDFLLKVKGKDAHGYPLQRLSSIAYTSVVPGLPKVNISSKIQAYNHEPQLISCSAQSEIPFRLQLSRGGKKLGEGRLFRGSGNSSWLIPAVSKSDEGFYECTATSKVGATRARTFVSVTEPPPRLIAPGNITALPGQDVVMSCTVLSDVPYNLTWSWDWKGVQPEDSRTRLLQNRSLEISSVQPGDGGQYKCIARNAHGAASASIWLLIQEAPWVKVDLSPQRFTKGEELKLNCTTGGHPPPRTTWKRWGRALEEDERVFVDAQGTLHITAAVPEDAGNYSCHASSLLGWVKRAVALEYTEPPVIVAVTPAVKALVGEDVVLECWVSGVPVPQIVWYRGEQEVVTSPGGMQRGVLQLQAVREEDSGEYICEALSEAGVSFDSITLDVGSAPRFSEDPEDASVEIGESVSLLCRVEGSPPPRIAWSRQDGKPMVGQHRLFDVSSQLEANELFIASASLDDQAIYICEAQNEFGKIRAEVKLAVTGHAVPEIARGSPVIRTVRGQPASLPCVILAGKPFPARHWLKHGQPITPGSHYSVRTDGSLHVEQVSQEDAGSYTCVVTNAVGSHRQDVSLVVHVPPSIELGPALVTATEGAAVTLSCNATGVPPPTVTWAKVGVLSRLGLRAGKCGGQGYGAANTLSACDAGCALSLSCCLAKPRISVNGSHESSGPMTILAVVGQETILPCEVQGYPTPLVAWTQESQPVPLTTARYSVLPSGSLRLAEPRVMDNGLYTCTATNAAGNASLSYSLEVQVPPNIEPSELNVTVLENATASLQCLASGVPAPDIAWYKGSEQLLAGPGLALSGGGKCLEIQRAQTSDSGSYRCVASNMAGSTELWYSLQVTVPPSFSSAEPAAVSVLEGQVVQLACECHGIPFPTLTWWKDGRVFFLNLIPPFPDVDPPKGRRLRIPQAEVTHSGHYVCLATNAVGQEEREFDVSVHVPPEFIQGSGSITNISVSLHGALTLTCEASGVPPPTVTWFWNNSPVIPGKHTRVLSGGWMLRLTRTRAQDGGLYSCLASNVAGEARRDFHVEVLVSPMFPGEAHDAAIEDVTVIVNNPISLICEALAYPSPNITWLKDEVPLEASRNVHLLPGGHGLQILNALEEDAGIYSCVVTSEAGEAVKNYTVKVLGEFAVTEVKTKVNSTVTLECESWAVPEPTIQWYKDGQLLESAGHLQLLNEGKVLQIKPAGISDSGHYTCVATNVVGEDDKDFNVHIQGSANEAFEILYREEDQDGEVVEHRQAILDNPTTLYCDTSAIPPPRLTWYKDGEPLSSGQGMLILLGGRVLQLPVVREEDAGRYTCEAANDVGEDRMHYELEVLKPPRITGANPETVDGIVDGSVSLVCDVQSHPDADIVWYKDGRVLQLGEEVFVTPGSHILQIPRAQLSSTGIYMCVALNAAGRDEKLFILTVHVAPRITSAGVPSEHSVLEGSEVTLECQAEGQPAPEITWLKDGQPLGLQPPSRGRSLLLEGLQAADAGAYTCLAQNSAGEDTRLHTLSVLAPPRVEAPTQPVEMSVVVGAPLELTCLVTGVPMPTVTWEKDGQLLAGPQLVEDARTRVLAEGRFLQIRALLVTDRGEYSCTASNSLGTTSLNFQVDIHVAPEIQPGPEALSVLVNGSAVLPCQAEGWPVPQVTWRKDGQLLPLGGSPRLRMLPGGSLQIDPVQVQDSGYYLCVASSPAGSDRRGLDLQVLEPPVVKPLPGMVMVMVNASAVLSCEATGVPPPEITWQKEG
ncbi:Hemicentin-2, partial [Struthio camelus australis]